MKKKFEFDLKKETILELSRNRQNSLKGGTCPDSNVLKEPSTEETDCLVCPLDTIVPTTAMATCSTDPNSHFGCNTTEDNCIF
ncbi:MAG: hypothetical protein A2X18_06690 [Bacteroidetes bacterium GWF2_40_14]|nr:MAG: hypothetical protein A2X18_06690 [Bacteroidetes bacterium GWF2_40_14]